jgi:hypothetical protein
MDPDSDVIVASPSDELNRKWLDFGQLFGRGRIDSELDLG